MEVRTGYSAGNKCDDHVVATNAPHDERGPDFLGGQIREWELNQNHVAARERST
jgi:hypothetical protein